MSENTTGARRSNVDRVPERATPLAAGAGGPQLPPRSAAESASAGGHHQQSDHRAEVASPPASRSSSTATSPHRLHRAAGLGGIGAFVAWAGQPVVVALSAAGDAAEYPDYDSGYANRALIGGVEVAIFTGIGVGLLFLVLGTWGLIRRSGYGESVASRVGLVCGLVGSSAWLLVAGAAYAPFTSVGTGLPEVAPDPALQAALLQTLALVLTGGLMTFAVGMTGWTIMIATAGRRAGVVGWPMAIVALVFAAIALATFAMPFQPPWGMIGLLMFGVILGIRLLVAARKA